MQILKICFIIILVVYVLLLLYFSYKNGKIIRSVLLSALIGIITFTVVNLLSGFSGVGIPVNAWTLGSSATFGLPGVLGLLLMRMII